MLREANDALLLEEIAKGDEAAFCVLFDRYKNKVYNFAYHFTHSVVQSEEIVQEVFLKIWLRKEDLRSIEKFEAWVYMVTRNLSFNILRKIAFEYSYKRNLDGNPVADTVEDQMLLKEYLGLVHAAVEALPAQQKKVYKLRREQGLKTEEIAEELGLSPNTVKVHLSKALGQIRTKLNGKLDIIVVLILTSFFAD